MPKTDAGNPTAAPLADKLRDALAEVPKGRTGREPSPLREHVAAVFDELVAKRKAGATWEGLAAPFAALGIWTERGEAPSGVDLRNAFHAERYARGGKRKRRSAKPKVRQPEAHYAAPEPTAAPSVAERPKAFEEAGPASSAPAPEAADLRALLARRRPALSEPAPVTLGPEDRRSKQEKDDDA